MAFSACTYSRMRYSRFSRDRTRMVDTLDVIKFICKDLWTIVFRKQIDNLKTNHRVHSTFPQSRSSLAIAEREC